MLRFAVSHRLPLVLATTGQTEEELQMIHEAASEVPLFFAANFSIGVALLIECAKKVASALPDAEIEIVEMHHDRKMDAPSGTAIAIANALRDVRPELTAVSGRTGFGKRTPNEIGIHSVRIGNLPGIHEVIIGTGTQTLTLKHEAHDRALFAEGALTAAAFLRGKPAGLYDMKSLF
ncbi:MAG: 4-hydroxy-tetrahydrodipicolinate reductase [Lachnospiraceae bacterium]|nr:4-hydroxy-tetrahydrodipicolinate reductase [Lachnospiraceae bacterium]